MSRPLLPALVLIGLLASAASAASPDYAGMQLQPYDPPKASPQFALPDLSGKTVTQEDVKGKVTLLMFWATW